MSTSTASPIAVETASVPPPAGCTRTLDSVRLGWTSVLVQRHHDAPSARELIVPAVPDQHVVLVQSGHGDIATSDGPRWRRAHRSPGQIALTAPGRGAELRLRAEVPVTVLHVHVPVGTMLESAERLWPHRIALETYPDALAADDPVTASIVRALARAVENELDEAYAESAAAFLAAHLVARLSTAGAPPRVASDDRRIAAAVHYLHEHFASEVRVADLAAAADLSLYHFIRLFHRTTGRSPYRYLIGLRVARARRRLEVSTASVAEIAYECGFPSASALAAAFRREMGVAPHRYRAAQRF